MPPERLNPAQDLLADLSADLDDIRSILVPDSASELVEELALLHPGVTMHWIPTDVRTVSMAPGSVVVHDNIGEFRVGAGAVDLVVMEATGDRDLARRWIALTRTVARPDGILLLAGANDAGIKSVIGDAREAIGPSVVEDFRRRSRVAHIAIPTVLPEAPPWAQESGIAPETWSRFTVPVNSVDLVFESLPGVFSADRLDDGTKLLLEHLEVPDGASVLDVGCGAGVIGVAAGRRGAKSVTMTDVNLLAIAAAKRNATLTDAPVEVIPADLYDGVAGQRFDLIVSNPPFHQGKVVDYGMPQQLISEARDRLNPGGRLVIVANAFLPYDRLMRDHFDKVEVIAGTRQYRVLSGR